MVKVRARSRRAYRTSPLRPHPGDTEQHPNGQGARPVRLTRDELERAQDDAYQAALRGSCSRWENRAR